MDLQETHFRELAAGTSLCNGKYTIEKEIGSGGFGITYKAIQSGLNRTVCVKEYFLDGKCVRHTQAKTVHLQGVSVESFENYRQKFVEEAKMLAALKHPNIVEVLDVFDENNTAYMVMPFIEGQTLQSLIVQNGALDYEQAVNYLGQIASAVGYIHSKNILHRDIKPENIIITPDYHAILIDFGSAREFVQDKTQAHTSMLTIGYAPIEQYSKVSRKGSYSDIYSLGAVYYFAMTGEAPPDAATRQDAANRHAETISEPKTLNPNITEDANRTILKAMAMNYENRHQTIDEFLDDLFGRQPSEPIEDDRVVIVEKSRKWLWIILAAVLVVAGIIVGLLLNNNAQKQEQIMLQQEIATKAEEVRSWIAPLESVFWDNQDDSGSGYHLFRNCSRLANSSNIMEGSVEQAFHNNQKHLCQECIDNITEYNNYQTNAERYGTEADVLNSEFFINKTIDFCNKVLEMRPDNKSIKALKQNIEKRR